MLNEDKPLKNYCSKCCRSTWHKCIFKEAVIDDEDEYYEAVTDYLVLKCLGCENISFRTDYKDYVQTYEDDSGEEQPTITTNLFPLCLIGEQEIYRVRAFPESVKRVYKETITSIKAGCGILAGVGFRATIEAICIEENIKGKNLEAKINSLLKEGFITKKEAERLHAIRFLGNDSVHEMKTPTIQKLNLVLGIVNHLLRNMYSIDEGIDMLLDTPINTFEGFKRLLAKKISRLNVKTEINLYGLIGRDIRRVNDQMIGFEAELLKEIDEGKYAWLSKSGIKPVGSKNDVQHFLVEEEPLPF